MNLFDLIFLVILLLVVIDSINKGLLNSCFAFLSSIIGLFAAIKYNSVLAEWVDAKFSLLQHFELFITENFVMPAQISQTNIGTLSLPDIGAYMDKINFSVELKVQLLKYILNLSEEFMLNATTTLGEVTNSFMTEIAMKTVIFVVLWFIIYKVAFFLSHFLIDAIQISLGDTMNKVGGLGIGICHSLFVSMVIFGMIYPFLELIGFTEPSFYMAVANTVHDAGLVRFLTMLNSIIMGELLVPWL